MMSIERWMDYLCQPMLVAHECGPGQQTPFHLTLMGRDLPDI